MKKFNLTGTPEHCEDILEQSLEPMRGDSNYPAYLRQQVWYKKASDKKAAVKEYGKFLHRAGFEDTEFSESEINSIIES